jgi:L-aminopeptidase/D-esterase-like protein
VALLQPVSPIESIHGLLLSGGGQFGLGAHAGMIRYLEDQKRGFDWGGVVRVPVVPGAVIDDLALGDPTIRPDPQAAYNSIDMLRSPTRSSEPATHQAPDPRRGMESVDNTQGAALGSGRLDTL